MEATEAGSAEDRRSGLGGVVRRATREFAELSGQDPIQVSGLRRSDNRGYSILVEVVEVERIPSTTSVLGTYRIDCNSDGHLQAYERIRRYNRTATDR